MRRPLIAALVVCLVTGPPPSLADAHREGAAAGHAANAASRATVNATDAAAHVPGYGTAPSEAALYRSPALRSDARARISACVATPPDPHCEALLGAVRSASTPRLPVGTADPAVVGARSVASRPSAVLGGLSDFYAGCAAGACPSGAFCLGASCFPTAYAADTDFARAMTLMEAGREAGVYLDPERLTVFNGEDNRCRDRLAKNCCYTDSAGAGMTNGSLLGAGSRLVYDVLMNADNRAFLHQGLSALLTRAGFDGAFTTYGVTVAVNGTALPAGTAVLYSGQSVVVAFDPWSLAIAVVFHIALSMRSCNEEEGKLALKEGARLCRTIGTWCSRCIRVAGRCVSCTEHTTSKCCFNSKLSRMVNEQGRVQVGRGWGPPRRPDCAGFTIAQLQRLDFAAMDLSEFYASIVPVLPDEDAIRANNAVRAPGCYYGNGRC